VDFLIFFVTLHDGPPNSRSGTSRMMSRGGSSG